MATLGVVFATAYSMGAPLASGAPDNSDTPEMLLVSTGLPWSLLILSGVGAGGLLLLLLLRRRREDRER